FSVSEASSRNISCGTYPSVFRHEGTSCRVSSASSTHILPVWGVCSPMIRSTRVDLLDPLGPTKATLEPLETESVMSRTAGRIASTYEKLTRSILKPVVKERGLALADSVWV